VAEKYSMRGDYRRRRLQSAGKNALRRGADIIVATPADWLILWNAAKSISRICIR
jgi:hypothetical protein